MPAPITVPIIAATTIEIKVATSTSITVGSAQQADTAYGKDNRKH